MTFTFDLATPDQVIGRIVGETRQHIAVAVSVSRTNPKTGVLLAVKRDGTEYVTWTYGADMAETGINVWNGRPFPVDSKDGYAAFKQASSNLRLRASEND